MDYQRILNYNLVMSKLGKPVLKTSEVIKLHRRIAQTMGKRILTPFRKGFLTKLHKMNKKLDDKVYKPVKFFHNVNMKEYFIHEGKTYPATIQNLKKLIDKKSSLCLK